MSGPFLCYREIIPPTSVDTAKFFTHEGYGDFLITLTSAAINIYRVHPLDPNVERGTQFSLLLHTKLFGRPYDVNVFSSNDITREGIQKQVFGCHTYIILNFDCGKVSISKFDPSKCSLDIVRLFNAEEEAIGAGSEVQALTQGRQISPAVGATPYLAIDKEDLIACTLLYGQQFFFMNLSFLNDQNVPLDGTSSVVQQNRFSTGNPKKDSISQEFIVDIQLHLRLLGPILDYCFLPGYSRPTLAVLQECGTLPSGHIATVRNTCCISVLAVDKVTKSVSLLWRQLRLPHDSICIIPLSNPSLCGSIALVSMNAVLLVSQETVIGTATCGFASTTVSSHIKLQPSKLLDGLELDASRWIESDNTTLVGSLKDGRLISIHLLFQSESLLQEVKFEVDLVAHSIQSSCFCKSETSNFWFLGSRLSDCLLIEAIMEYSEKTLPHVMTIDASQNSANITPALKRLRRGSDGSYISVVDTPGSFTRADRLADIISEEQDLYGSPLVPKQSVPYIGSGIGPGSSSKNMSLLGNGTSQLLNGFSTDHSSSLKYALRVVDTISVLGPVLDGTFCANDDTMDQMDRIEWNRVGMPLKKVVPNPASAYIVDREAKDSLHLYTGLDNQSGVHRITRGVRVSKLASRSFPGAISVHCLAASEAYSLLFVDFVDRSRVFQCTAANVKSFDNDKDLGSMILSSDLAVKEISCSDAGFISTAPTITVGIVHENVSVQVVSTCVRVVNMSKENGLNGEALQDVFVADDIEMGGLGGVVGEVIVRADICESWVALLTSIGSVYLLEFQESDEMLILKYSARCSGSKNDKEEDGKELSSDKPEECSSAQEGNTMPSYDNLLSLNPVTISLFYGHFPTLSETIKSKKVRSKVPSTPSSFSSASSSSASSSSASSSADVYVTPAQTLKSRNTSSSPSLSLLLPDNPKSQKKKEKTISLLEKQQLEEEIFLYGAHMDDVRSNRTTDLDVQHNFRECNNYFQDSKMDFDDETHSASETKYVETGVNDFSSSKCKVNFIDGDSEQKTSNCGEISAESKAENGIYQTPGKEEDKEIKKSKETEEKEEEECSQDPMDIDDAELMYLKDPERMYLVLSDYNGIVIVMSLCTLRTVFVTEEICLLPRFIKLSSTSTSHNNNDNDNDNKINNDNVIDKHDNDILTSRVSNSVRNNLTESNEHPVTPGIGPVSSRIPTPFAATPLNESNERAHTSRTQHRKVTDRVLIDARFARIGREDSPFGLSKLCLIIVLESSDVIVYYLVEKGTENIPRKSDTSSERRKIAKANESQNGIDNDNENEKVIYRNESYFVKLEHSVVTRKKRNRIRKKGFHLNNINNSEIHSLNEIANGNSNVKSSSNINDKNRLDNGNVLKDSIASPLPQSLPLSSLPLSSLPSSSLSSSSSYYIDEDTDSRRIQISYNSNGRSSVLISGSRPITIINDSGLPFLAPLGLPELPFSNSGSYFVVPLKVGSVKGIASLWIENDDIEGAQGFSGVNGLLGINNDIKKPSVLQLYQEIPNQIIFPGSVTSSKKLHSGLTTHHCIELLAKSEDSTEQALLKRKTFILSCSTEKHVPFLSTVLTNDEKEKEETFYDRFFPSLDSFCQPDVTLAPAPLILYREHKLVIMQSGTAVDEFIFPLGEQILGVEALYLNVTTTTIIPAVLNIGNTITMEKKVKRVFLVACTSVEDKHGEDTQGEGRIMLFGLDYALFQDAVVDNSDGKDIDLVDHIEDPTSTSTAIPVSTVPGILGQINLPTPVLTLPVPKSKSQQSLEQSKFFKAIQPKLKLLWTGPGPASIVKQVGEFILSTVGTTVYIYRLNSDTMELEQITFYFAQFFISSVSVMKNYILIADVCNSVQFLVWREEDLTLTLVSKDMDSQTVLSTAFISDGSSLGMVVGDDEGNIQLMKFDPRKIETKDGSRLFCMADFHLGSDATLLLSHSLLVAPALLQPPLPPMPPPSQPPLPPMPPPLHPNGLGIGMGTGMGMGMGSQLMGAPPLPPNPLPLSLSLSLIRANKQKQSITSATGQPFGQRLDKISGNKSCVLIGTIDGGLGMLLPVEERMYRRLALLQQIMCMGVATPCALNPRDYRLIKTTRFVTQKKKGVLDGSLLWKFIGLESTLQDELAAAMGITTDTILENLLELDLLGTFF